MLMPFSALLLGIALGLRYNVCILIPGSVTALTAVLFIGFSAHDSYFDIALLAVSTTAALQIGFMTGSAISSSRTDSETTSRQVPIEQDGVVHFPYHRLPKTQSL